MAHVSTPMPAISFRRREPYRHSAMKLVVAGGSGQLGQILARHFAGRGHEVVVLCRHGNVPAGRVVRWDPAAVGAWAEELEGAEAVVNLAGRSVNCRYTPANLREMLESRVVATRTLGEAIRAAARPPRVWLQMSTATIYAHTYGAAHGETNGVLGGSEPGVPAYWTYSVRIAREWEAAQQLAETPATRKVALRTSMVMSPDRDGVFDVLLRLVRRGLGGSAGDGRQYVSWIADGDFARAVEFLLAREDVTGPVNLASPGALPNRGFMRALRQAWGTGFGLPATKWMLEMGAWAMRTDPELVLKSRRVFPERLLVAGFRFDMQGWPEAATSLVRRWRAERERPDPER
jgi:uncharacterized protein (TIGR01777 family)